MKDISICDKRPKKKLLSKIAGHIFEIEYQYPYVGKVFHDYLVEPETVDSDIYTISYTQKELEEIEKLSPDSKGGYLEFLCIFDKIAMTLMERGIILMHGALIEYEGEGFLFTAPSGTGKSTHISLWKKYLGDQVVVVNGDKPELEIRGDDILAYGTPWCGKESWQVNKSVPLKGVCLIRRGTENKIQRISAGDYIEFLIPQFYFDIQSGDAPKVFDFLNQMADRVPFYLLECDISEEAAKCSFETMTGKEWRKENED